MADPLDALLFPHSPPVPSMKPISRAAPALFLALAAAACDRSPVAHGGGCLPAFDPIVQAMDSVVEVKGVRGGALFVMQGDQVLCEATVGRYARDEVVPIASASKWLTAVTLLTLVEDGTLSLDDPASAYVPAFGGEKAGIRVGQLLSNTSGVARGDECVLDPTTTLERCTDRIAQAPLDFAPGTAFWYAGAPFTVAGRVAEAADGRSWGELFAARVKGPLDMRTTTWGSGANPVLSGGARSSVRDYAKMLRMVASGGVSPGGRRILSAALVAEMARNHAAQARVAYSPRGDAFGYGLGVWRDALDAEGRATQVSSPGASGFVPWVDFDRGVVGVMMLPARDAYDGYWYARALRVQAEVRRIVDARG